MFKTSVATRVISFAVLITLLLASFPTAVGAAKTNNQGLETKWAKLVAVYNRQSIIHAGAPRWVEQWLNDHRRAPASKRAELQRDLTKSNTAWAPAPLIVHEEFESAHSSIQYGRVKSSDIRHVTG